MRIKILENGNRSFDPMKKANKPYIQHITLLKHSISVTKEEWR